MNIEDLWEELKFEIDTYRVEVLENKKGKTVLGAGSRKSDIMFVGDDPNLFEDEHGTTLPGSSGEFFYKLCNLVYLKKEDIYITNLGKCNCKLNDLNEKDREKFREYLDMQIALIKPKIVVALGQEVAKFLLRDETLKINEVRGKIYNWDGNIKLMAIYDPAYLLRETSREKRSPRWFAWKDMENLKRELQLLGGANG
jgi:DNA polymerase